MEAFKFGSPSFHCRARRFGRRSCTAQVAHCSDCAQRFNLLRPKARPRSGEVPAELPCSHWLDSSCCFRVFTKQVPKSSRRKLFFLTASGDMRCIPAASRALSSAFVSKHLVNVPIGTRLKLGRTPSLPERQVAPRWCSTQRQGEAAADLSCLLPVHDRRGVHQASHLVCS